VDVSKTHPRSKIRQNTPKTHPQICRRRNRKHESDKQKRHNSLLALLRNKCRHNSILQSKQGPANQQQNRECLERLEILRHVGIKLGADGGKADHGQELDDFADALVDGVDGEAHVEQRDVQPCRPDDGEEARVRRECYRAGDFSTRVSFFGEGDSTRTFPIVNLMHGCERGQVRDEK
jgi:hypothetical protein